MFQAFKSRRNIQYKNMLKSYDKTDGIMAVLVAVLIIAAFVLNAWLFVPIVPIIIFFSIFALVYYRKQTIHTIGLTRINAVKSSFVGLAVGSAFFLLLEPTDPFVIRFPVTSFELLILVLPLVPLSILFRGVLYSFAMSFYEEIMFRGYIQTRIYGIINSSALAILTTSVLFSLAHMPSRIFLSGGMYEYFTNHFFTSFEIMHYTSNIIFHIVFNFLYMRHNNITGSIIAHGVYNMRVVIFSGIYYI